MTTPTPDLLALADCFHLRKDVIGQARFVWDGHFYGLPAEAAEKIVAALRACAEERDDAERFRWLRTNWTTGQPSVHVWWDLPATVSAWDDQAVVSAIDAARRKP